MGLNKNKFTFDCFFTDINCDGIADIVLEDPKVDNNGKSDLNNGQLYILYGPLDFIDMDMSNIDASTGLIFSGQTNGKDFS